MNEHQLNDPQLSSLEARLASATPHLPLEEQQRLLYQCAFAAGRKSASRSLAGWRAAAATFLLLALGTSASLVTGRFLPTTPVAKTSAPKEARVPPGLAQVDIPLRTQPAEALELDAWQNERSLGKTVANSPIPPRDDSELQSLTVVTLTREVLVP